MKISEIITDKYKLRLPPTVYYELLADVVEAEEEQEPTDKNFTKADIDAIVKAINAHWELIIDEIRAEIEFEVDHRTNMLCAEDVFAILDKYKAEMGAEDGNDDL